MKQLVEIFDRIKSRWQSSRYPETHVLDPGPEVQQFEPPEEWLVYGEPDGLSFQDYLDL